MPRVTVAAVNGACAGGGILLAAACDLRFAAETAVFITVFLTAGLPGDYGASWSLTRIVSSARARQLMYLPDRFRASRAHEIGLVSGVFPAESLASEVDAIAQRLAAAAPMALAAMKANLNDADGPPLSVALDAEAERLVPRLRSEDMREAARAFRERRVPVFHGC